MHFSFQIYNQSCDIWGGKQWDKNKEKNIKKWIIRDEISAAFDLQWLMERWINQLQRWVNLPQYIHIYISMYNTTRRYLHNHQMLNDADWLMLNNFSFCKKEHCKWWEDTTKIQRKWVTHQHSQKTHLGIFHWHNYSRFNTKIKKQMNKSTLFFIILLKA